ncbi:acyl-CoA N-acyltransferase [Naematelia encephala]|uniref:Acyl-CoA N-acyltransferase n=1 Tax=Naematelia encephala TaxID=71784 RepID=A0A1Y2ATV0_9TREE|nr:acyl-CoA N-acyltransferase [Naematelia encephala]
MPQFRNSYTPPNVIIPPGLHLDTPVEEYDYNYVFEVDTLRSDRVELRPFTPSLHAQPLYDSLKKYPDVLKWLSISPFESLEQVVQWSEKSARLPSDSLFYAIYTDKPGAGENTGISKLDPDQYEFAGIIGMIASSAVHMTLEPGYILIMPPYQRTHVLTHSAGLVMHRALDMPEQGGLGLRRCQWTTTTLNTKSQAAALRLGFKYEGVLRAQWVIPAGKEGARPGRQGVQKADCPVRDNWWAAMTWEDWEGGVREHIDKLMSRRS